MKEIFLEKIKQEKLKEEYYELKKLLKKQGWRIRYEDTRLNQGYLHINHYVGAFLPVMVIENEKYSIEIYPEIGGEEMYIFSPEKFVNSLISSGFCPDEIEEMLEEIKIEKDVYRVIDKKEKVEELYKIKKEWFITITTPTLYFPDIYYWGLHYGTIYYNRGPVGFSFDDGDDEDDTVLIVDTVNEVLKYILENY